MVYVRQSVSHTFDDIHPFDEENSRNINTSESVPKKGRMIERIILCPSFEICLPTRQGCNPVTIPHYTLLPCSASMWACLNALLLGRGPSNLL